MGRLSGLTKSAEHPTKNPQVSQHIGDLWALCLSTGVFQKP